MENCPYHNRLTQLLNNMNKKWKTKNKQNWQNNQNRKMVPSCFKCPINQLNKLRQVMKVCWDRSIMSRLLEVLSNHRQSSISYVYVQLHPIPVAQDYKLQEKTPQKEVDLGKKVKLKKLDKSIWSMRKVNHKSIFTNSCFWNLIKARNLLLKDKTSVHRLLSSLKTAKLTTKIPKSGSLKNLLLMI